MLAVSVILPTYNERENIAAVIRRVHDALGEREHEILVVDDRSPDGTGEVVSGLSRDIPGLRLITKETKEGIGAAIRVGYESGRFDVLASMDADLSFSPEDLPKLLARIDAGSDLVLGSRHTTGGGYETPNWRIRLKFWVSWIGNLVVRGLIGLEIADFSANFRAIRRSVWNAIKTEENTNALLLEMILKVRFADYRIEEVPIRFSDRLHGKSKLNLWVEAPKFFVTLIRLVFRLRILGQT